MKTIRRTIRLLTRQPIHLHTSPVGTLERVGTMHRWTRDCAQCGKSFSQERPPSAKGRWKECCDRDCLFERTRERERLRQQKRRAAQRIAREVAERRNEAQA